MSFRETFFGKAPERQKQELDPSLEEKQWVAHDAQRDALRRLQGFYDKTPVEGVARGQIGAELAAGRQGLSALLSGQRQAGIDTKRRIGEQIAQRGLGQSSIGLSAMSGVDENTARQQQMARAGLAEREAAINASLPERLRKLNLDRITRSVNLSSGALGSAGVQPSYYTTPGSSGLFPALMTAAGAGLGAYASGGSPQGTAAGARAGAGAGQMTSGAFQR